MHTFRSSFAFLSILCLVLGWTLPAAAEESPFEITEERPRCTHHDELKQPFFGTTHLHTGLSFDASIRFVPSTPREAYRFAKGEAPLPGVGPNGVVDLEKYENPRPIDWGVVTDHSEQFGSMGLCKNEKYAPGTFPEGLPESVRYSLDCQLLRGFYWQPGVHDQEEIKGAIRDGDLLDGAFMPAALKRNQASTAFAILVMPSLAPGSRNTRLPLCEAGVENRELCQRAELGVWDEMQAAAEEAYDRSSECKFTSFVGYEAASTPSGTNWHRNVIFRNAEVIPRPITTIDMAQEANGDPNTEAPQWLKAPRVEKLWQGLREQCLDNPALPNCDVLTIPHNSNLGGGVPNNPASGKYIVPPLFFDPRGDNRAEQAADAQARQDMEPLVEIFQDKGSSECRFDPRFDAGVGTSDELCDFEILDTTTLLGASGVGTSGGGGGLPPSAFSSRAYVRNVLKDGLRYQKTLGVNPFKLGIVAASDSHNGTMGWHPENATYGGHEGIEDAIPVSTGGNIQNNSGGHSVVWAEENSRDSIFEALKRRETYGTSGPRPVVRFFGGWDEAIESGLCDTGQRKLAEVGYDAGVPMGGDLQDAGSGHPPDAQAKPRFIVAVRWDDVLRTPLQRAQIIKGWLAEENGELVTHESVIDVAVAPGSEKAGVDPQTCEPTGPGADYLCGVMVDEDFDPEQPAFYYARVLENPVCRYSTHICREDFDLDPLSTSCADDLLAMQNSSNPEAVRKASQGAMCCSNETTDYFVQPVIQERAWTSPIWYTPSAE